MINEQKKELRKKIRSLKKNFSLNQKKTKSNKIFEKLEQLPEFANSKVVMAYWSMDDEVFTHDFVLKYCKEKQIILPVVKGDVLELKRFAGLSNLKKEGVFGIEEPTGEVFQDVESIDMILVPGVAFDTNLNRLGRGKAYYDKLLKTAKAVKVGICFDFQIVDSVPTDRFDVKMDKVLCD
jgi:5-formyltetrahydrofolate cyclo-ligase